MNGINKFGKVTGVVTKIGAYCAVAALLFNVVIILLNIIFRAFGSAIVGTEEFIGVSEIVVIFMALGYTQYTHGLVHVAFFMKKFPRRGPVIMWSLHQWIGVVIIALLIWQTFVKVPTVNMTSTALMIPFQPFYFIVGIGCIIYEIAQVYEAVKSTVGIFNEDVRKDVVANFPA